MGSPKLILLKNSYHESNAYLGKKCPVPTNICTPVSCTEKLPSTDGSTQPVEWTLSPMRKLYKKAVNSDVQIGLLETAGAVLFMVDMFVPEWGTEQFGKGNCSKAGMICFFLGGKMYFLKALKIA